MIKKLLVLTISMLLFLQLGFASLIRAQTTTYKEEAQGSSLTIAPSILDLDVRKKQHIVKKITISDGANFSIPIKIEVRDYTVDKTGVPDFSYDETKWSARSWIKVTPTDFIIKKEAKRTVTIDVKIPDYAESGSHFLTIIFQPVLPPDYFIPHSTHIVPYIGAVVALNVDSDTLKMQSNFLEIQELRSQSNVFLSNQQISIESDVKNKDSFFHRVDREITVKDIFHNVVSTVNIPDTTLFPTKNRIFLDTISGSPGIGRFTLEYSVHEGDYDVSRVIVFWILPSLRSVGIALGAIFVLCVLFFRRRQIIKAFRLLFINK